MEYVYILTNDFIPNSYKIGYTSRHPNLRASEINQATGIPGDWVVAYSWQVEEGYVMEQKIFKMLHKYRINKKEIFEIKDMNILQIKEKVNNLAEY